MKTRTFLTTLLLFLLFLIFLLFDLFLCLVSLSFPYNIVNH